MDHGKVIALAVALMVAAQIADVATFIAAIAGGVPLGEEFNPIARAQFLAAGPLGMIAPKLLVIAVLLGVVVTLNRWDARKQALVLTVIAAGFGFFGTLGNSVTLLVWR